MTIAEALVYGRSQLTASPSPQLDARLLLQHVLQQPHSYLVGHHTALLTEVQAARYRQLIARAAQQEPIPYLTGTAPFYGRDFAVSPAVLIPRPETEQLVETAAAWAQGRDAPTIVDVGTGSGCIAITLARLLPAATIFATELSAAALAVAQQNEAVHAPGRVHFRLGHLLDPVPAKVDLIVANLPYVTEGEWTMLDDGVKWYEPSVALLGGVDGLALIRQLLNQATTKLNHNGAIFLEIGWQQGEATRRLAKQHFATAPVQLLSDFAGHDRIVVVEVEE